MIITFSGPKFGTGRNAGPNSAGRDGMRDENQRHGTGWGTKIYFGSPGPEEWGSKSAGRDEGPTLARGTRPFYTLVRPPNSSSSTQMVPLNLLASFCRNSSTFLGWNGAHRKLTCSENFSSEYYFEMSSNFFSQLKSKNETSHEKMQKNYCCEF